MEPHQPRNPAFTRDDVQVRLARTRALPQVGRAGLARLLDSRVLVVGCGGVGQPAAAAMVGAGVGHLTLVDDDDVEPSNLNRQFLSTVEDEGRPKPVVVAERLRRAHPHLSLATLEFRLTDRSARGMISGHDVVVDATDDPATKFLLNDACLKAGVPLVHGGAVGWHGQVTVITPGGMPCLRCLFEEPPPAEHCQDAGVFPGAPALVGALMAAEAVKLVLDVGTPLRGRMLAVDLLSGVARTHPLFPRPDCAACAAAAPAGQRTPRRH